MKRALGELRRVLCTRFFIDYNSDYGASVLVAGTGRSGTTWVSNIINYRNRYRYILEPFHPHQVSLCAGFRYRQYLRPGNQDKDFIEPARAILSGRIRNRWTDSHNRKLVCGRRLIKDIRANCMLMWLHVNFPGVPIVLVLRHPCAVANSRLKLNWGTHLDEFLAQRQLMEDFLGGYRQVIEEARSAFDRHILLWCIENYVPLKQFGRGEIHLAFYERFCEEPENEVDRLFSFLGQDVDAGVLAALREPSPTSRKESAVFSGSSLTNSWKEQITHRQMLRALEILSLFGLDKVYSRDSLPDLDGAHAMMREQQTVGAEGL